MGSPSTLVYEFVDAMVVEVNGPTPDEDSPLFEAQMMDSAFAEMTGDRGVLVSNAEFDLAPRQENVIDAMDALVIIAIWVKVNATGSDTSDRAAARDECFEMAKTIAGKIYDDMSLGGRVCDSLLGRATDGYRNTTSTEYAAINLPIVLNPTGQPVSYTVGEVKK